MNTEFPRIKRLPPYVFNITGELKMAARHRGEDSIDFSMGNPDGPTPQHIVDKMIESARKENTHGYSVSKGIWRLRKAMCNWYKRRYDVDLDPDKEAIVTIGSKEGLAHLMLACCDRGDTVLVPNPSYPIHIYGAIIAGADIRSVKMIPGVDFLQELERAIVETVPRPKMMILGFPSNPTAQCVDLEFFEKVVALAKRYGVWVVHDLATTWRAGALGTWSVTRISCMPLRGLRVTTTTAPLRRCRSLPLKRLKAIRRAWRKCAKSIRSAVISL